MRRSIGVDDFESLMRTSVREHQNTRTSLVGVEEPATGQIGGRIRPRQRIRRLDDLGGGLTGCRAAHDPSDNSERNDAHAEQRTQLERQPVHPSSVTLRSHIPPRVVVLAQGRPPSVVNLVRHLAGWHANPSAGWGVRGIIDRLRTRELP